MGPDGVERVYGVDFSGATAAGEGIWLAAVRVGATDPVIERCDRVDRFLADRYPGRPVIDRGPTLAALRRFVRSLDAGAVVGVDCPFGLPASVARGAFGAETWVDQIHAVAGLNGSDALADRCRTWANEHADATFLKRGTDAETGALSPYHWFVRHQTYHGSAGLLAPLVAADVATVLPMQADAAVDDTPRLIETYPAATLDRLGLHREGYKGSGSIARDRRAANLDGLLSSTSLRLGGAVDRGGVLDDTAGDALDSVLAAAATVRFVRDPSFPDGRRRFEGHIYA